MSEEPELFTIGELAQRTGLAVRTIRFWSDSEVVTPSGRSAGGYRLYDAEAVARLDLVRTLRELGLDLASVRQVLSRQVTVQDVAEEHLRALDGELRTLQTRRAVLRWIARRGTTTEEMRTMHEVAKMSADERQRIIDDFVGTTFEGIDDDAPGAHIAQGMRSMPPALPDDPTTEQVDAWVELAELVADEDFRRRCREMAVTGAQGIEQPGGYTPEKVMEHGAEALREGVAPESARGAEFLDRIVDPGLGAEERLALADTVETFTDRRVERYWQLLGVLNGWPAFEPHVPNFEWLIAALRAHA
ncbi:MerR family transcriptional regulator [Saccharopolyspora sp. TS4A08]|uniref:MerR family transcriptional regulator n=1 Tax=Saccharopolyspora ipomoeae TaxID=3042027 RepID=A0ABT6PMQ0_9PSEU|nr:MerR family transcriptional regulator [Saccharopolyspora sp. TS4A08]MDI2029290.1 MerR family transcriptional regulator [Saccharopolyspora sp. TS4A08]